MSSLLSLQDEHQWLQSAETPGNAPAKVFKGLRYAATPRCCSEARTATCPQLPQHHPSLPHKNTHNHAPRGTRTSAGSDTPPPPSLANAHTHRSIAGWSAQHVKWAWRTGVELRQAHSRCSGANAVPTRRARLPLRHVHRMPCTHWRDGKKARRLLSKHLPQQTCSNSPSLAFSVGWFEPRGCFSIYVLFIFNDVIPDSKALGQPQRMEGRPCRTKIKRFARVYQSKCLVRLRGSMRLALGFGRGRFQANLQHDCERKGKNAVFKVAFCYSLIWQTNGFDLRLILDCIQNI